MATETSIKTELKIILTSADFWLGALMGFALLLAICVTANAQEIVLPPGDYPCPTISSGTIIRGLGPTISRDLISDPLWAAAVPMPDSVPVVRFLCDRDVVLKNVTQATVTGVIFDFQGTNSSLILESSSTNTFEVGIQHTTSYGLKMIAEGSNNALNRFPVLNILDCFGGIHTRGSWKTTSGTNTWNDFGTVNIIQPKYYGILLDSMTDTNHFGSVRISSSSPVFQVGIFFNPNSTWNMVAGNRFDLVSTNSYKTAYSWSVLFRGPTAGNVVTVAWNDGIAKDRRVAYDNPLQHHEIVTIMPEQQ